jgi:hypothetical protein
MAARSHSWFEPAQLLPSEALIREGPARLRTASPPYWWDGALVLTTDRIIFAPSVENPLERPVAFWLAEVVDEETGGPNLLRLSTHEGRSVFQLPGLGPLGMRQARAWERAIAATKLGARPRDAFEGRRAAG